MNVPQDYRELYDALPYKRKQQALAAFRKWGCWSKATVYNKLGGESVTPIEQVLIDGVLRTFSAPEQLEINFIWDASDESLKCDPK